MKFHVALPLTFRVAAVLEFITSSPELKPNSNDEDKNKITMEFGQPELLLIAKKKMSIYSSARIAETQLMLTAGFA